MTTSLCRICPYMLVFSSRFFIEILISSILIAGAFLIARVLALGDIALRACEWKENPKNKPPVAIQQFPCRKSSRKVSKESVDFRFKKLIFFVIVSSIVSAIITAMQHIFVPLSTQNALFTAQKVVFLFSAALNCIALVCLLKQTPPHQAVIRKYLIFLQVRPTQFWWFV